jgi:hypothetical protein
MTNLWACTKKRNSQILLPEYSKKGERKKTPLQSLNNKLELPEIAEIHVDLLHIIHAFQVSSTI